ncbi:MAG TPA: histidine phosphatase family protein [Gaiella sp.]|nr:histidine phosphatase family protein [Gaiella sp.]
MSVELVFETHSLTTDNERGVASGWNGGVLSERGRALAAELGDRRRNDAIDLVVSSDLARAVETARIAFFSAPMPLRVDWRLREVDYGALTGSCADELERARYVDVPFPGGESYRDVVVRMERFLDDLGEAHAGARVLLIGHTATRWALDRLIEGRELAEVVTAPFGWREGWQYRLDGRAAARAVA